MRKAAKTALSLFMGVVSVIYISPIFIVLLNSFKLKTAISASPFTFPTRENFVGLANYVRGMTFGDYPFYMSVLYSVVITVLSTTAIFLFTSMAAWYITRVDNKVCRGVYYLCVFSMIVPFQMVMYTLSKTADTLNLNNPLGIVVIYLGFGAGLAYALCNQYSTSDAVCFAEAASCLKHSIEGDFNLSTVAEVEKLAKSFGSARTER